MNSTFQLTQTRTESNLCISLSGIFDGASAWDLIQILDTVPTPEDRVVIDTNDLTHIHPFGKLILDKNLPPCLRRDNLLFSGQKAENIMPRGCRSHQTETPKKHICRGRCPKCKCKETNRTG